MRTYSIRQDQPCQQSNHFRNACFSPLDPRRGNANQRCLPRSESRQPHRGTLNMNFASRAATVVSVAMLSLSSACAVDIYSGEPLGEALHDLAAVATPVSHDLASASPLLRTDVFRLSDGRLIAITSRANKLGEPYEIESLRVTSPARPKLTKHLPTISSIELPKKRGS